MKKIPLWGKVLPVIAMAIGIAAVVAGSGIAGDVQVKVQEPLDISGADVDDAASTAGVVYNDNLSVTVTAETYPGETFTVDIEVKNNTSVDQDHRLTVTAPDGFRFSEGASPGSAITLTQEEPYVFVFTAKATAAGDEATGAIPIKVEVLPQVAPGWYSWTFETEALETDLDNVG
jgi:hypothetical protein